ncbi:L-glutamine synthetase [Pyrobaculum calidifontis JCM 11548]|uniref:L-glutamine synthetase n=2 Tax=Pyrobaculum calidifontis TaxID=181486 RepID=A3MWK9_PYRCJ|nr:L-glutamine synthetase [Pyrobaculum calidifontis JCM 11548]
MSMPEPKTAWRLLKSAGVKYVRFVIVDIFGRPRVDILPIDEAKDAFIDGVLFDGSSIPAYGGVNRSDFVAMPDLDSVYIETWNGGKTALIFTSVMDGSRPSLRDPRNVLKSALETVKARGYKPLLGVELEFFLVKGDPPMYADGGVYFDGHLLHTWPVLEEIMEHFHLSGIGSTKTHHEVAPGQYEVNIPAGDPLEVADKVLAFKILAKSVAQRHGYTATFMPKPFWGINGSGAHVHLSLWRDGENLFASVKEPREELKYAVAGILQNAIANSVFVAPTVNSYKRLVPHHEAPTRIVWGLGNRSAMVRVPYYGGRINRLEYRHPDPSMNPYVAFASIVFSAYMGVEKRLEPPPPVDTVAYELEGVRETPRHLGDAVKYAQESALLPEEFVKPYLALKEEEWLSYLKSEGDWEKTWNKITRWEYNAYLVNV